MIPLAMKLRDRPVLSGFVTLGILVLIGLVGRMFAPTLEFRMDWGSKDYATALLHAAVQWILTFVIARFALGIRARVILTTLGIVLGVVLLLALPVLLVVGANAW